jgi:hypothetical protein
MGANARQANADFLKMNNGHESLQAIDQDRAAGLGNGAQGLGESETTDVPSLVVGSTSSS